MENKLIELKKEWDILKEEYDSIYDSNKRIQKDILLDRLKEIEQTFRNLDLNVCFYKIDK